MDYDVTTDPEFPVITVKVSVKDGADQEFLIKPIDVADFKVHLKAKGGFDSKVFEPIANEVANSAPGIVKKKVKEMDGHTVKLEKGIGYTIVVEGVSIPVQAQHLKFAQHDKHLLVTGDLHIQSGK
ncbi:hypothetical protein [Saccharothrix obliqua]|uniref:hypothetical protein n=1 Tax=Saccharothrix obliqua TaxID=2861747 RepID=UPI001C5FB205|nr:hypothetical protein [Saccharothrix obliqua]MBW4717238.1 hypothetical protein [Saccharothrix obliqua]